MGQEQAAVYHTLQSWIEQWRQRPHADTDGSAARIQSALVAHQERRATSARLQQEQLDSATRLQSSFHTMQARGNTQVLCTLLGCGLVVLTCSEKLPTTRPIQTAVECPCVSL